MLFCAIENHVREKSQEANIKKDGQHPSQRGIFIDIRHDAYPFVSNDMFVNPACLTVLSTNMTSL